eukprot:scaffold10369_cov72-Phaeocystis_antarctica.AAC.2
MGAGGGSIHLGHGALSVEVGAEERSEGPPEPSPEKRGLNASTKEAQDGRLAPSLAWAQEARRPLPGKSQHASTAPTKEARRPVVAPIEWRRPMKAAGASSEFPTTSAASAARCHSMGSVVSAASAALGPNEERNDWPASVGACEAAPGPNEERSDWPASVGACEAAPGPNEERSDWPASVGACEPRRDAPMPAAKAAAIEVE